MVEHFPEEEVAVSSILTRGTSCVNINIMEKRVKIIASILIVLSWVFGQRINNLFDNFFWSSFGNWLLIIGIALISGIIIYRDKKNIAPADAKRALFAGVLIAVFILGLIIYLTNITTSSIGGVFRM